MDYSPDPQSKGATVAYSSLVDDELQDRTSSRASARYSIPRKPVANVAASMSQPEKLNYGLDARRSVFRSWTVEVCAAGISAGSLAALVILIFLENGRPLTAWRFAFSLNTVISILGTIAKLSLAVCISAAMGQQKWNFYKYRECEADGFAKFDAASRGPWGSAQLLGWLKLRHLASLGAMVTILSTTFDPFLQATIYYTGRLVPVSGVNSGIGRIERLDVGTSSPGASSFAAINSPYGIYEQGFWTQPDFRFTSAANVGIDNTSSVQVPQLSCNTGNCTWPAYTSIALCSACNDVSGHILKTKFLAIDAIPFTTVSDQSLDVADWNSTFWNSTATNYSLPYSRLKSLDAPSNQYYPSDLTFLTLNMTADYRETITFQDFDTLMAAFLVMRAGNDFINGDANWNESAPTATECGLYFCVQQFESESRNTNFQENVTHTWAIREPNSWEGTLALNHENGGNASDYEEWTTAHPSLSHQYTSERMYRTDLQLLVPANESISKTEERYNITQTSIASFQDYLLSWFIGQTYIGSPSDLTPDGPPSNSVSVYPFNAFQVKASKDHAPIAMLYYSDNLTSTFNNFSSTLTTKLRDSNVTTFGEVQQYTLYTSIRWPFLIVPLLLTLIGLIYAVAVIIQTRHANLPAWKTDILPLLAYGLPNHVQHELRSSYQGNSPDLSSGGPRSRTPTWHNVAKGTMLHFDRNSGLQARNTGSPEPWTRMQDVDLSASSLISPRPGGT